MRSMPALGITLGQSRQHGTFLLSVLDSTYRLVSYLCVLQLLIIWDTSQQSLSFEVLENTDILSEPKYREDICETV